MEMKPRFAPYVPTLELIHQGKVRDTYRLGDPDLLLMVATDRMSTHDVVHLSTVPKKGEILTAMTVFMQTDVLHDIPTHIVAFGKEIYNHLPKNQPYQWSDLHLRSLVVQRLQMVPYELIFRARMAGSLWKKYYSKGLPNPYGLDLPAGLHLMDRIDPPAFTPTEKSETDDPVSVLDVMVGRNRDAVLFAAEAYEQGRKYALSCGIDIIDAKFEVGYGKDGTPRLADEWLTGDCSRFVRCDDVRLGQEPPWMDKEVFRQDAVRQWGGQTKGEPLVFSEEVIAAGLQAYRDVFETLSGFTLESFQADL